MLGNRVHSDYPRSFGGQSGELQPKNLSGSRQLAWSGIPAVNRIGEVNDRRKTVVFASLHHIDLETENNTITSNHTASAPPDTTAIVHWSTGFDFAIPEFEHNTVGYNVPVHTSAITDTTILVSWIAIAGPFARSNMQCHNPTSWRITATIRFEAGHPTLDWDERVAS